MNETNINSVNIVKLLADTLSKAGSPLNESQEMLLQGAMAILFPIIQEQAARAAIKETRHGL